VILHARGGHARLAENIADAPGAWKFRVQGDSPFEVRMRDVMEGPLHHRGLVLRVDLDAEDPVSAGNEAVGHAEPTLAFAAASARAPIGDVIPLLSFDVTPDIEEREFAQWFYDLDFPLGKAPASVKIFGPLLQAVFESADTRVRSRLTLSVSWYTRALRETQPLIRFLMVWMALEAVSAPLADRLSIEDNHGHQSLRRIANDPAEGRGFLSEVLDVRRKLLHDLRTSPGTLAPRADAALPRMENVLLAAWSELVDPGLADSFPAASVNPSPLRLILLGVFSDRALPERDEGTEPLFTAELSIGDPTLTEDGRVTAQIGAAFTLDAPEGVSGSPHGYEIWGPSGPDLVQIKSVELQPPEP
jgi:hypothetical protein